MKAKAGADLVTAHLPLLPAQTTTECLDKLLHELFGLYREIAAADRVPGFNLCEADLKALSEALHRLCDVVETDAPRLALMQINDAVHKLHNTFEAVDNLLGRWQPHLGVRSKGLAGTGGGAPFPEFAAAKSAVGKLKGECKRCCKKATKALKALCDSCKLRQFLEGTGAFLQEIRDTHDTLLCLADLLDRRPEVQFPFTAQLRQILATVGGPMATVLRLLKQVHIEEPDIAGQLTKSLGNLQAGVEQLTAEVRQWGQNQLCAPPEFCQETTGKLLALTTSAQALVGTLRADPSCRKSFDKFCALVEQVDEGVEKLKCQTAELQDFRTTAFDTIGMAVARISLLCQRPEPEDPCLLTEGQLTQLANALKESLPGFVGKRAGARQPAAARFFFTCQPATARSGMAPAATTANLPAVQAVWDRSAQLLEQYQGQISGPLYTLLTPQLELARRERERLGAELARASTSPTEARRESAVRWGQFFAAGGTARALATAQAPEEEKRLVRQLGARLDELDQQMRSALGDGDR